MNVVWARVIMLGRLKRTVKLCFIEINQLGDNQTDSNLTSSPTVVTEQPCNNPKPTHPTTSPSL